MVKQKKQDNTLIYAGVILMLLVVIRNTTNIILDVVVVLVLGVFGFYSLMRGFMEEKALQNNAFRIKKKRGLCNEK